MASFGLTIPQNKETRCEGVKVKILFEVDVLAAATSLFRAERYWQPCFIQCGIISPSSLEITLIYCTDYNFFDRHELNARPSLQGVSYATCKLNPALQSLRLSLFFLRATGCDLFLHKRELPRALLTWQSATQVEHHAPSLLGVPWFDSVVSSPASFDSCDSAGCVSES